METQLSSVVQLMQAQKPRKEYRPLGNLECSQLEQA